MTQATHTTARSPRRGTAQAGRRPRPTGRAPRMSVRNRYSIFVGFMKVLLPALAAALVLLVVAWPQFNIDDRGFRLSVSKLAPDQADSLGGACGFEQALEICRCVSPEARCRSVPLRSAWFK